MAKNSTSFKEGNKAAEKWTEEEANSLLDLMRSNAENNTRILSLQDAILSVDLYTTSLNYIIDKFPVFENIKKDIQDIIIARINKGALEGDYNPTAGIWRMKQLGEVDSRDVTQTINDKRKSVNDLFPSENELDEEN